MDILKQAFKRVSLHFSSGLKDEDCVDETASCSHETEETDSTEWASDYSDLHETRPLSSWSAPIHSPVIHGEEVSCGATISCQCHEECQSHLGIDETCTECTHHWETDQECIFCKGVEVAENSTHLLSRRLKSCGNETDCVDEVLSVIDLNHSEITSKIFSNQSNTYAGEDSEDSSFRCQGVEKSDLLSPVNDIKMEKANGVELTPVKPTPSHISCQEKCVGHGCSQNICDIPGQLTIGSFNNNSEEGDSQSVLSDSLGHYATCGNIKDAEISSPQCLSLNDPASNCCTVDHQESSGHSVGGSQNMQAEDSYQSSATAQLQQLSANQVQHSYPADQYELSQISEGCKYFPESNICNCIHVSRRDLDNSNYSAYKASNQTFITNKDNSNNEELKCKHSVDKGNLKGLSPMEESYDYQTIESRDGLLDYRERQCDKDILSYKQHHSSYTDRINNETIDVPCDINHPKEGSFPLSYQNADMTEQVDMSAESQYIPYDGQPAGWRSDDVSEDTVDSGTFLNSQVPDSETFTTNQNTVTQAFPLSSEDHEIASTCSSVASSHPSEENHEAVLCADDQTFKSVVLRRPIVVTSMPAGCSLSYMSDMNCSMYGSAVVQALGRPAVMSSSSIHFAKHAGSATMMQHQSMSAGLNGGMAHANIMRHQAVPNRAQTTSVLQHHSLINGGRAMVVQQRTMMTGVGGVAQQTVIQQRVAAPANMTQPAMMRVGAVRQRAFTPQQASLIQQRGIRFVPSGVLGTPLLQSQTIQSTAVYEGRAAALMGQGLVSGVNQGHVMQCLVQQRYLGGPLMPGRGVQLVAGHPVRLVNK